MRRIIATVLSLFATIGLTLAPSVSAETATKAPCATVDPEHVLERSVLEKAAAFTERTGIVIETHGALSYARSTAEYASQNCGREDSFLVVTVSDDSFSVVGCYDGGGALCDLTYSAEQSTLLGLVLYLEGLYGDKPTDSESVVSNALRGLLFAAVICLVLAAIFRPWPE